MSGPSEEDRWHQALERLGPEIQRTKPEPGSESLPGSLSPAPSADASPEPVVDPSQQGASSGATAENSRTESLRYWAAVAGAAGVIAAITGLLALLPMSMR